VALPQNQMGRVQVKPVRWQTNSLQPFALKMFIASNGVLYQKGKEFQIGPKKSTKSEN
jgi:hypothetical protein